MNISFVTILPLGCLFVVGAALAIGWGIKRMGIRTNLDSSASTAEAENQVVSLPEDTNTKVVRKYLPYLLSPLTLALLLYLISLIPLLLIPAVGEFGMLFLFAIIIAFTGFSAISPIINLFQPRWWLNTVLYIVSWFLLFYGLISTLSWGAGEDMSIAAIGFGPAMMVAFFVLIITAVIKLVMFISSQSQNRT